MSRRLTWDRYLFGAAMLIVVVGLVMIYSASAVMAMQRTSGGSPYHFLARQCVWLCGGITLMLVVMHLDIHRLRSAGAMTLLVGAAVVSLIFVLFQASINGTHRWIVTPYFSLQPAELAKPVVILFLAVQLAQKEDRINDLIGALVPIGSVLALLAGLILVQPDFGTALTIVVVALAMLFVAGISWRHVLIAVATLIPASLGLIFSADYRRIRFLSFLNPEADPQGAGFQAMQSLIAIGTGGFTGLGIGNGRQKLFFLPEPHTDFIFSIIGEELGFAGAVLLLGAFAVLVWRGFRIAWRTNDRFTFYAALGFTLMIAVQVLVNVSVALCLLPTKGLPLPLVSYGGSSLVASLIAVGMLLNLSQQT